MNSILNGPISRICFGLTGMRRGSSSRVVFLHAALHQREREGGAVDRHVDLGKEVGNRSDVVFMAVRQDQAAT